MKVLSVPRHRFVGVAFVLVLLLSACGAPLAGESWPGISTDGKYLYVAFQEHIFRVNPALQPGGAPNTRPIEWLATSPGNTHMYAPPAIGNDGVLYEGAYDHNVYAFPETSQPTPLTLGAGNTADAPTDRFMGGAVIAGDLVYIGMGDKGMIAYNRTDGSIKWKFTDTQYGVWGNPVLVGGTLYFGSMDHFMYALDAQSGKLVWKADLGGAIPGTPFYDNGLLYVGTFNNELLAVATKDGKVAYRFKTQGWVWATPILKDGVLYLGDLSGYVYALNEANLTQKWSVTNLQFPGAIRGAAVLTQVKDNNGDPKDVIIVGSESKYLMAFDAATGASVWTSAIAAQDQILSDLIVMGDEVICTTPNASEVVAAYNIQTGQHDWDVVLPDQLTRLQTATNVPLSASAATAAPTQAATAASTQ